MDLQSARALKQQLRTEVLNTFTAPATISALGVPARRLQRASPVRSLALGIAPTSTNDFRIAVRVQRSELGRGEHLERIRAQARGELEVRYIGRVNKSDAASLQGRLRPLQIGCSVGHFRITAGTLGCFVKSRTGEGRPMMLSN